jgi:hypothetical protein
MKSYHITLLVIAIVALTYLLLTPVHASEWTAVNKTTLRTTVIVHSDNSIARYKPEDLKLVKMEYVTDPVMSPKRELSPRTKHMERNESLKEVD